jgi:hypothetical protein
MMMKMRKRKRKSRKVEDGVGVDGLVGFDLYSSIHLLLVSTIHPCRQKGEDKMGGLTS